MRKRIHFVDRACVALLAAIGISGCTADKPAPKANAAEAPAAMVAVVAPGSISHTLSLAGQFQPYQEIDVHPKVSGFIRHIYVDIGDKVHEGEVLAVLEIPELSAELKGTVAEAASRKDEINRAEHDVVRAESERSALHADYTRLKEAGAAQPGLIAQQELDDAQSKDMSAEAQVDAAKSALSAAKQNYAVAGADNERVGALENYTRVVAPLDGVITQRYADTGALIQAGTASDVQSLPLVKLAESGVLRLRLPVPEDAVRYIHEGTAVQVRVDALDRSFTGKVVRFTRSVSPETRTMETEVDVDNKNLSIDPGMYANAEIQLAHVANVLTVPVGAIVDRKGGKFVYMLDDQNRILIRPVHVGLEGSLLAEVDNGLRAGDRVLLSGQERYSEGERISPIVQAVPSTDTMPQSGGMIDLHDDQGDGQGAAQ